MVSLSDSSTNFSLLKLNSSNERIGSNSEDKSAGYLDITVDTTPDTTTSRTVSLAKITLLDKPAHTASDETLIKIVHLFSAKVKSFLELFNGDINGINENGATPLALAIINKDYDMVKSLLENGAKMDIQFDYGTTLMSRGTGDLANFTSATEKLECFFIKHPFWEQRLLGLAAASSSDEIVELLKQEMAKRQKASTGDSHELSLARLGAPAAADVNTRTKPGDNLASCETEAYLYESKSTEKIAIVSIATAPAYGASSFAGSIDSWLSKLLKNSYKAICEHRIRANDDKIAQAAYMTWTEVKASIAAPDTQMSSPLSLKYTNCELKGQRKTMEDAHFNISIAEGQLAGVFDGHGGSCVATYASLLFPVKFSQVLKETKRNVRQAFTTTLQLIHSSVSKRAEWNRIGSTAVVCFIDKHTNLIYTATLGDSEANIYRYTQGTLKSIPLSCVRDWSSAKDAKRAADCIGKPEIAKEWPLAKNSKHLRYPKSSSGINVSRAIGDVSSNIHKTPGIIQKPKITVHRLLPGDTLVVACDGLKDYVKENEIVALLAKGNDTNVAKKLANYAINNGRSTDNVTVLAFVARAKI